MARPSVDDPALARFLSDSDSALGTGDDDNSSGDYDAVAYARNDFAARANLAAAIRAAQPAIRRRDAEIAAQDAQDDYNADTGGRQLAGRGPVDALRKRYGGPGRRFRRL